MINIEYFKLFYMFIGCMYFYLVYDWVEEFGEQLFVYWLLLDMVWLFNQFEFGLIDDGFGFIVCYLMLYFKWLFYLIYQDNLYMLLLFCGGLMMWMSLGDVVKINVCDNDWVEVVNVNGIYVCWVIVSYWMFEGVVFVYYVQECIVDMLCIEINGKCGGNYNVLICV